MKIFQTKEEIVQILYLNVFMQEIYLLIIKEEMNYHSGIGIVIQVEHLHGQLQMYLVDIY